ncbi:MAG TPA: hypothetical protein VGY14_05555 [Methyloceanibacter sp.]|jgi:hypothetical protein|nr:hypothetical protein [Methyloceanibacter sp.]
MKILSLLVSLLLGTAVLLVFFHPWGALQTMWRGFRDAAPANPSASAESTAAVDTATPKPAEVTPKLATPPASTTPEAANPAVPKTHLLANEQAAAERSAALDDQMHATAPAPRETKRYFKVRVRDAETRPGLFLKAGPALRLTCRPPPPQLNRGRRRDVKTRPRQI